MLNSAYNTDIRRELSADGKTYTYTQRDEGSDKPAVIILHRSE